MTLYIIGPTLGVKSSNLPALHSAVHNLIELGRTVSSPIQQLEIFEQHFAESGAELSAASVLSEQLPSVCGSDAVVFLAGWQECTISKTIADVVWRLGKQAFEYSEQIDGNVVLHPIVLVREAEVSPKQFPPAPSPASESVLQEAQRLIYSDRHAAYGDPSDDFKKTADMWTGLFQFKLSPGASFRPQDVALAMILVKCSRAVHFDKRDNFVDIAGYAGCGQRCVEKSQQPTAQQ